MTHILETLAAAGARSFPEVRKLFEAAPFCLKVTEVGRLYHLRYSKTQSDLRNHTVRQARGIVLEKESNRIISWGFDKFYEYGEAAPSFATRPNLRRSVPSPGVRYERKYDGVFIKVVRHEGRLLVGTNGRIDAEAAPILNPRNWPGFSGYSIADGDLEQAAAAEPHADLAAAKSLWQAFGEAGGLALPYEDGVCYAFELLHGDVPTVVPTNAAPSLIHLMARRMSGDFGELPLESRFEAETTRPSEVVQFPSFAACRAAARLLPWDDEGFVMAEAAGTRVKVKSDAFKAMQRLLVGDFEVEEQDAACVALTLGRATTPLPSDQGQIIREWRWRCEAFAEGCLARVVAAQRTRGRPGPSTARGARARLEAALGGRLSREVRAALARSLVERLAPSDVAGGGDAGSLDAEFLLGALRSSGLPMADICQALRAASGQPPQSSSPE